SSVEIVATKSARGASTEAAKQALDRIQIEENASPSSVRIETKLAQTTASMFGGGSLEVHYAVRVPDAIDLNVTTINDGVELRGLKGRVAAEATNGGVKGRDLSGPVDASTTNGGVELDLAAVGESGVKLSCTNGGIGLSLPRDAKASISARIV